MPLQQAVQGQICPLVYVLLWRHKYTIDTVYMFVNNPIEHTSCQQAY
jgi:hypothetical protein